MAQKCSVASHSWMWWYPREVRILKETRRWTESSFRPKQGKTHRRLIGRSHLLKMNLITKVKQEKLKPGRRKPAGLTIKERNQLGEGWDPGWKRSQLVILTVTTDWILRSTNCYFIWEKLGVNELGRWRYPVAVEILGSIRSCCVWVTYI